LGKIKWTEQVQNRIKSKVIVENTKTVLELYQREKKKKKEKKKKNKFRHYSINLFSLSLHETADAGQVLPLREQTSQQRRVLSYKIYLVSIILN
jgi:hypothetical protein